jgi:hypothetical protein
MGSSSLSRASQLIRGVMQTEEVQSIPATDVSPKRKPLWRSLALLLVTVLGAGHVRYCWSSTYRVRNASSATLQAVEVPLSFDGPNHAEVAVGDLRPGRSAAGTLPRFAEASVGVSFLWEGKRTEACYGYVEGSMAHVDFVVAEDGSVTCEINALGGFVLGWLNTL